MPTNLKVSLLVMFLQSWKKRWSYQSYIKWVLRKMKYYVSRRKMKKFHGGSSLAISPSVQDGSDLFLNFVSRKRRKMIGPINHQSSSLSKFMWYRLTSLRSSIKITNSSRSNSWVKFSPQWHHLSWSVSTLKLRKKLPWIMPKWRIFYRKTKD